MVAAEAEGWTHKRLIRRVLVRVGVCDPLPAGRLGLLHPLSSHMHVCAAEEASVLNRRSLGLQ